MFDQGRTDPSYLTKIFRDIGRETWGDTLASSSLTMAFQNKMIDLNAKELERERLKKEKLLEFNETEKSDLFFRVFDNTCRRALFCSILEFNDFNQPIMSLQIFDDFVDIASHVFPKLWKHFCLLRNMSGFRKESNQVKEFPRRR